MAKEFDDDELDELLDEDAEALEAAFAEEFGDDESDDATEYDDLDDGDIEYDESEDTESEDLSEDDTEYEELDDEDTEYDELDDEDTEYDESEDDEELSDDDAAALEAAMSAEFGDEDSDDDATAEESDGGPVKLSLDGTMKDRRKQRPVAEEPVGEDSADNDKSGKKKGKGKSAGKKKKEPVQSSLTVSDGLEIESVDPVMTDNYVGSSGVMHVNGVAKVCERNDDKEDFTLEYIALGDIKVSRRIRVVIPDAKLKRSIAVNGVLEPIVVAPLRNEEGKYALIDGAKRLNVCKELGFARIPCVYGHTWKCRNLSYLEGISNMQASWGGAERLAFANRCLDDGIRNETMIESLCDMDEGEAHKAIDLVTDNDTKILSATAGGKFYHTEVSMGYKKLEARRKKEYEESLEGEGAEDDENVDGEGEGSFDRDITPFTADIDLDSFNEEPEDVLSELHAEIEKGREIEGFEAHQQKVGEREVLDPSIRKAALERSGGKCLCCRRGGESYVDCLDAHHVTPVYLGGKDELNNIAILCITCHRMVHLYGTGDLHLDATLEKDYEDLTDAEYEDYPNEQIFNDERVKMLHISRLGNAIREGARVQKMKREELKKEHPVGNLGRRMPGKNGVQTDA